VPVQRIFYFLINKSRTSKKIVGLKARKIAEFFFGLTANFNFAHFATHRLEVTRYQVTSRMDVKSDPFSKIGFGNSNDMYM
jgi:hypothetical protein